MIFKVITRIALFLSIYLFAGNLAHAYEVDATPDNSISTEVPPAVEGRILNSSILDEPEIIQERRSSLFKLLIPFVTFLLVIFFRMILFARKKESEVRLRIP